MATVVAVMDTDSWGANTDNIVVVQPGSRRLLWVPRDVWCEPIHHRINKAYARGGHATLIRALGALGLTVHHSVCLRRGVVEQVLVDAAVKVKITQPLRFWYPERPGMVLEDGMRPVDFDPPGELLAGQRIHEWLGARKCRDGPSSDLYRISRQQVFVRTLLYQGFDFRKALDEPRLARVSGPGALNELRRVRAWWRFDCYDRLVDATINGMQVLVPRPGRASEQLRRIPRRAKRLVGPKSGRPG